MSFRRKKLLAEDAKPLGPVERWFQTITSHYSTVVCLNLVVFLSVVPTLLSLLLLLRSGALIFLPLAVLTAGLTGPVWAAVNAISLELQFGFPTYLWRGFLRRIRENLLQGCALALVFAACWGVLTAVLWIASVMNAAVPLTVFIYLCLMAFLLCIMSSYAYYQIASRTLSTWAILKNSLLLIFAMGWRSAVIGLLWIIFIAVLILFYPIMVPVCIIFGLPVLHCVTIHAIIHSKMETIFRVHLDRPD